MHVLKELNFNSNNQNLKKQKLRKMYMLCLDKDLGSLKSLMYIAACAAQCKFLPSLDRLCIACIRLY